MISREVLQNSDVPTELTMKDVIGMVNHKYRMNTEIQEIVLSGGCERSLGGLFYLSPASPRNIQESNV